MKSPRWIGRAAALAMHEASLVDYGGLAGVRDMGMLESALDRPKNLFAYGTTDYFELAGAHASAVVRKHPFFDGNKRTAFLISIVFLETHGFEFCAAEAEAATMVLSLAAKRISEREFSKWLAANSTKP